MKNTLEGINSRVDEAENQISKLEHKEVKTTQLKEQKKKERKNKRK